MARKVAKGTKGCRCDSCFSLSFVSIAIQMLAWHEEGAWITNGAKGGERHERVPLRFVFFVLFRVYRDPDAHNTTRRIPP